MRHDVSRYHHQPRINRHRCVLWCPLQGSEVSGDSFGVTARVAAADGTLGATDGATHVAWHGPMAWLGGLLTCYGPHIHITQGLGAALSAGARWRCRAGHADMSNAS